MSTHIRNKKPTVRFIIDQRRTEYGPDFLAQAVYLVAPQPNSSDPDDEGVRNPSCTDSNRHLLGLAGLCIAAYLDRSTGNWGPPFVSYRDEMSVKLTQAEQMVATLRLVERHLRNLDDQFGTAPDLAAFCGRVASAFKCDRQAFGLYSRKKRIDGRHYRWLDVDALRLHLEMAKADGKWESL